MRKIYIAAMSALVLSAAACGDTGGNGADTAADTAAADTLAVRANAVAEVALDSFTVDPETHVGHEIRLTNAYVDSRMGQRAFWIKLSNQGLYLVRSTPEIAAAGQPNRRVTAAGTIREMTDSVVQAWIAEGAITADQEMEARYAESYMDAWYVSSGQQARANAAQE